MQNWLLPEYIQDMLPDEAWCVEQIRGQVLGLLRKSGYQLVVPPLLEYAESLLIDGSADMDLRTFKLVDQLSGRTLALRADITPQVARIDAHLLNREGVTRLCYAGSVLHTQPIGLTRTRELLQIGAELYGHSGVDSDLEIQRLMLQSLALLGIANVHLDLGHVAVFRALVQQAGLDQAMEGALFAALQNKDSAALQGLVAGLDSTLCTALLALPTLYGSCAEVTARARKVFPDHPTIRAALDDLVVAASYLEPLAASVEIDLADLRGYHYHSGVAFAAYCDRLPNAIALGGRYDGVGKAFGRARPATGFTLYLLELARLAPAEPAPGCIRAPRRSDPALEAAMASLRRAGEVVIQDLPGHENEGDERHCGRELIKRKGKWQVKKI